jgi:hypothetical protein
MFSIILLVGIFLLLLVFIILGYILFDKYLSMKNTNFLIKEFVSYMSVLKYFEELAYDIVYKKEILAYSLDGWTPTDEDYKRAAKSFVKLVFDLLGKKLTKELENIYGSYSSLIETISLYFYSRIESDEIRKIAVNDLISDQGEENNNQEDQTKMDGGV